VKIEGNPDSPASRGKICPKGLASIDHLYNPDRITHPMKRVGERGDRKWERITWDDAYDILVKKIKILQDHYGPETIAIGHGTGRYHFTHVLRFAHALGTPNWALLLILEGNNKLVDENIQSLPKTLQILRAFSWIRKMPRTGHLRQCKDQKLALDLPYESSVPIILGSDEHYALLKTKPTSTRSTHAKEAFFD